MNANTESINVVIEEEVLDTPEVEVVRVAAMLPNRKGMTLVEIMIVLTILAGIMVAVGVVAFDQLDKANIKTTKVKLVKIDSKIQEYYAFQSPSAMPDSLQDLVNPPNGEPPYLKETDLKDAWGQDISGSISGRKYELSSAGPDGNAGSADDINHEGGR